MSITYSSIGTLFQDDCADFKIYAIGIKEGCQESEGLYE